MDGERMPKVYDKQFKIDAVSLVTKEGRKIREASQDLGIDPNTLYSWKRELEASGEVAFPGKGHLTEQEEEIRRLKRALAQAEEDREIFKKALGYFSRHGKWDTRLIPGFSIWLQRISWTIFSECQMKCAKITRQRRVRNRELPRSSFRYSNNGFSNLMLKSS